MTKPPSGTCRRQFSRIELDCPALLHGPHGVLETRVLDICLKGVLVAVEAGWTATADSPYRLELQLAPGITATMEVGYRHSRDGRAGFVCRRIDLDSLCHLRRIAELNLADAKLLQRELAELFAANA